MTTLMVQRNGVFIRARLFTSGLGQQRGLAALRAARAAAARAAPPFAERASRLRNTIVGSNWEDPVVYMQNMAFWEAEMEDLHDTVPITDGDQEKDNLTRLGDAKRAFECYVKCADIRDHIATISEHSSRHAGILGTGFKGTDDVDNFTEHAEAIDKLYNGLKTDFPEFRANIEDSVGKGLALMRQKHKFNFSDQHRFFF